MAGITRVVLNTKRITAAYTRPANTTAYTSGDALSDSTTAPTALTFTNVGRGSGTAKGGTGVILSAAYALWLYRKMVFGTLKPAVAGIKDIGLREAIIFAPLVILTILFGVAPKPVLDMSSASVAQLLDGYNKSVKAAQIKPADNKQALVIKVRAVQ